MKPHLLKVPIKSEFSFSIRHDRIPYFYNHWHYHPEVELIHIHNGTGTQFMGDNIGYFKSGDMILVGANLAHLWKCDEPYFDKNSTLIAEATVIHFVPEVLGEGFFKLPENELLFSILEKAKQGIVISGKTKLLVSELMKKLLDATGPQRIIYLLTILSEVAVSKEIQLLSSKNFYTNKEETNKLDTIYQYVLSHFREKISLDEIAALANLSTKAFCRYFKTRTRRTFSGFLMEVRIGYACKLLSEKDISISDVCFESGFNNVSNFNRYFKLLKLKTPLQYKKEQLMKES